MPRCLLPSAEMEAHSERGTDQARDVESVPGQPRRNLPRPGRREVQLEESLPAVGVRHAGSVIELAGRDAHPGRR